MYPLLPATPLLTCIYNFQKIVPNSSIGFIKVGLPIAFLLSMQHVLSFEKRLLFYFCKSCHWRFFSDFSNRNDQSSQEAFQDFNHQLDQVLFVGREIDMIRFNGILGRKVPNRKRMVAIGAKDMVGETSGINAMGNEKADTKSDDDAMVIETVDTEANGIVAPSSMMTLYDGDSDDDDEGEDEENSTENDPTYEPPRIKEEGMISKAEAVRQLITNPQLLANADRDKRSNLSLMREGAIYANSLGISFTEVKVGSSSSIDRKRKKTRDIFQQRYELMFKDELKKYPDRLLCLNWDGKVMSNSTSGGSGQPKVDRVPILITGLPTTWLLQVPKLEDGTGKAQAAAILQILRKACLEHRIFALCFDTTATNTGSINGTVALLESELKKSFLDLYCCHHEHDLVGGAAYEALFGSTQAPTDEANNDFAFMFPAIKNDDTHPLPAELIEKVPVDLMQQAVSFLQEVTSTTSGLRGDYRELADLSLCLLGQKEYDRILAPGSTSNARWMGKLIYSNKRALFRESLEGLETDLSLQKCLRIGLFTAVIYCRRWLLCDQLFTAPENLLGFYHDLCRWQFIDPIVATRTREKLDLHLSYIAPKRIWLSFFSPNISAAKKRDMRERAFGELDVEWNQKISSQSLKVAKKKSNYEIDLSTMELEDLMTPEVGKWCEHFGFDLRSTNFEDSKYAEMKEKLSGIPCVNDCAERAVKLAKDYNSFGPRNEEEHQKLLKTVDLTRKTITAKTKKGLAEETAKLP